MARLAILAFALSMLFTACCPLTSQNPLTTPAEAIIDQQIAGTWKSDGEDFYFHLGQKDNKRVKVLGVEFTSSSEFNHALFTVLLTEINKKRYIDIDLSELSKDVSLNYQGHIFVQYHLPDPDTLVFSSMNEEALTADIQSKKIAGTITYQTDETAAAASKKPNENRKIDCVSIIDSTPNIRKYLGDDETARRLFKDPFTMHRVKTKSR
jgi:hypothetical protein